MRASLAWAATPKTQPTAGPTELRVYPGANGEFTVYEDEGDTYHYEKGAFATYQLRWNDKLRQLRIAARRGSFPGMAASRSFSVVLVRPGHGTGRVFGPSRKNRDLHWPGPGSQLVVTGCKTIR